MKLFKIIQNTVESPQRPQQKIKIKKLRRVSSSRLKNEKRKKYDVDFIPFVKASVIFLKYIEIGRIDNKGKDQRSAKKGAPKGDGKKGGCAFFSKDISTNDLLFIYDK